MISSVSCMRLICATAVVLAASHSMVIAQDAVSQSLELERNDSVPLEKPTGPTHLSKGLSADEVKTVMGIPANITPSGKKEVWIYGSSSVWFEGEKLTGWSNSGNLILHPPSPNGPTNRQAIMLKGSLYPPNTNPVAAPTAPDIAPQPYNSEQAKTARRRSAEAAARKRANTRECMTEGLEEQRAPLHLPERV